MVEGGGAGMDAPHPSLGLGEACKGSGGCRDQELSHAGVHRHIPILQNSLTHIFFDRYVLRGTKIELNSNKKISQNTHLEGASSLDELAGCRQCWALAAMLGCSKQGRSVNWAAFMADN